MIKKKQLTLIDMVKRFQCPGCVVGNEPKTCSGYKPIETYGGTCKGHVAGTMILGVGTIALGLPKGFNHYGTHEGPGGVPVTNPMTIRLWANNAPAYDKLNVPVWRYEEDGFLFVRVFAPRVNGSFVDVVQLSSHPVISFSTAEALDVARFVNEID